MTRKTEPESAAAAPAPPPRSRRRKPLRHQFCDGLEAAVQAEPSAFQATRPRTMLTQMVRELVSSAARGRCEAIKTVMAFLDEAELRRGAAEGEEAQSQGNSGAPLPPEPDWEWASGVWDASEREEPKAGGAEEEPGDGPTPTPEDLLESFRRAAAAKREEDERQARLAAEREGREDRPGDGAISGNISPPDDPTRAAVRIGGQLVGG